MTNKELTILKQMAMATGDMRRIFFCVLEELMKRDNVSYRRLATVLGHERLTPKRRDWLYSWMHIELPKAADLYELSKYFGVSMEYLLTGRDAKKEGAQS